MNDTILVKKCDFCGQEHKIRISKNDCGDEVIQCPKTGKVVDKDYYEED